MMKKSLIRGGFIVLMTALFLAGLALLTGCENDPTPGNGDDLKTLSGNVTISPDTGVTTGTELTAAYSGTETVTYRWKKDGVAIDGATLSTYTPPEAGSYTVTVSALGFRSITSAAVNVWPRVISIAAIPGVTAPVSGETPVTAITENEEYTGTVTWSPNHSAFAALTVYTATITLIAKTGYTLQGVPANFFTVDGATLVSNSANSGVVTAVFPATVYALGDTGPGGGKIFYRNAVGFTMTDTNQVCHYLEAAPDNMPSTLAWASSGYTLTSISGTETAIGTGRKNTALILATDANAPAAKACKDYQGPNNLTDWFLPSKDELNELYEGRSNVGNMGTNWYWSSSQNGNSYGNAWSQNFDNGYQSYYAKGNKYYVRAVRAF